MSKPEIKKFDYSVNPWRITLGEAQLEYFSFPRKKDAMPFLEALLAMGIDWENPGEEHREQFLALKRQTPGYEIHAAAMKAAYSK